MSERIGNEYMYMTMILLTLPLIFCTFGRLLPFYEGGGGERDTRTHNALSQFEY